MAVVLVTGANGFVGRMVCRRLHEAGHEVRAAVRTRDAVTQLPPGVTPAVIGDLENAPHLDEALAGASCVVHLAARVHVMHDDPTRSFERFHSANTQATLALARRMLGAGVRRIVYVSSIKVNGEATGREPFQGNQIVAPDDPYGRSKRDAETGLLALASEGLEVAIVRPPLVYGPGVKANFLQLMRIVAAGVPLPLKSVRNRRSMISVWNLADFIAVLVIHPRATDNIWLVADPADLSTPELIGNLARAMRRPARLFPLPLVLLEIMAKILGRSQELSRLTGSLQVDSSPSRVVLDWQPPLSADEGIRRTVAHFMEGRAAREH